MSAAMFATPKETDNVLLRLPSSIKHQAATVAEQGHVSANALIAAGVMYATLIYDQVPRIGDPENMLAFIEEIDQAVIDGSPVVGAFDQNDWEQVSWLLSNLNAMGWVKDIQVRRDVKADTTIVYTYRMSKTGVILWPRYGEALRRCYQASDLSQDLRVKGR